MVNGVGGCLCFKADGEVLLSSSASCLITFPEGIAAAAGQMSLSSMSDWRGNGNIWEDGQIH